jgi:hypothetical protein
MKKIHLTFLLVAMILTFSCKKSSTTINYPSAQITDYLQLAPGKSITYRLDSLEFVNFGTQRITVSYQAMDLIDTLITDNLGRPSWRVNRFLSDTTGTTPWILNETYMVTSTRNDLEVVENNLRFIKLFLPIQDGVNWSGNSYIDTDKDTVANNDPDLSYFADWNYIYDSVGMPYNTRGGIVNDAVIVNQTNQYYGDSTNSSIISGVIYGQEVYGKGIGLIHKNLVHWEYQPPNIQDPVASYYGYGIELNMISHN